MRVKDILNEIDKYSEDYPVKVQGGVKIGYGYGIDRDSPDSLYILMLENKDNCKPIDTVADLKALLNRALTDRIQLQGSKGEMLLVDEDTRVKIGCKDTVANPRVRRIDREDDSVVLKFL